MQNGMTSGGGSGHNLPAPSKEAADVLKKIASYIKYHSILMIDIMHHMDVHGDGKLAPGELKKQILTKIGVQISVAEANFLGKYLTGIAGGGDIVHLAWLEDAIIMHKPAKGGL